MTHPEALSLVTTLTACFPRPEVGKDTVLAYVEALRDLEYPAARDAVLAVIRTARFFPTVGEIRAEVTRAALGSDGIGGWEEAYGEVMAACGRIGRYAAFTTASPVVAETVRLLGWEVCCDSELGNTTFRAQFRDVYEATLERERRCRTLESRPLLGAPAPRREPPIAIERMRALLATVGRVVEDDGGDASTHRTP